MAGALSISQEEYLLHPLVVFSVLDHFNHRDQGATRVVGTLLGVKEENKVRITNSFPVAHKDLGEDRCVIEPGYAEEMLQCYLTVNPKETVVGWYSTGKEVGYTSTAIHDFYASQVPNPVHITVDVTCSNFRMGVHAYTAGHVSVANRNVLGRFVPVRMRLSATFAEKVGIDALIHGDPDDQQLDAPATLLSDFENVEQSMANLLHVLERVSTYVDDVVAKRRDGDPDIGVAITEALESIPMYDDATFDDMFKSSLQDVLMVMYLNNLTRAQLAVADKIGGLLQP